MSDELSTALRGSNSLADLRERLKAEHAAVAGALKTSVKHALAAGDILIEAKAQLNKHGEWLPWLKSCEISERTAQRYMRLARHRDIIEAKSDTVTDLGISGALALIAVPRNTGDDVADGMVDLADDAAAAALDFLGLLGTRQQKLVHKRHQALLGEAKAAINKAADLLHTPEFVQRTEPTAQNFCNQILVACDEFRASTAAEMGFSVHEFQEFQAAIDDLKERGFDDYRILRSLCGKFEFDRDPLPGRSPTAVLSEVRDIAIDWLAYIERERAAEAAS